jgi:hypothetical protein
MLRTLWNDFLELDPALAAALVAAAVSILTTVVTIVFSPVDNYLIAKRQLRDRLRAEYGHEQLKALRDLIGRYHGRVLQAAEELNCRLWDQYRHEDEGWLDVDNKNYLRAGANPDNYYFQSTVYWFLALYVYRVTVKRNQGEATLFSCVAYPA